MLQQYLPCSNLFLKLLSQKLKYDMRSKIDQVYDHKTTLH